MSKVILGYLDRTRCGNVLKSHESRYENHKWLSDQKSFRGHHGCVYLPAAKVTSAQVRTAEGAPSLLNILSISARPMSIKGWQGSKVTFA